MRQNSPHDFAVRGSDTELALDLLYESPTANCDCFRPAIVPLKWISSFERFIITGYRMIKSFSLATEEMYGLEAANIEIEKVPIQVGPLAKVKIKREKEGVRDERDQ